MAASYHGHCLALSGQTGYFALPFSGHNSMIPDLPVVKRVYYENLRDWMRLRPMDAVMTGRVSAASMRPTPLRPSLETDELIYKCERVLGDPNQFLYLCPLAFTGFAIGGSDSCRQRNRFIPAGLVSFPPRSADSCPSATVA